MCNRAAGVQYAKAIYCLCVPKVAHPSVTSMEHSVSSPFLRASSLSYRRLQEVYRQSDAGVTAVTQFPSKAPWRLSQVN